MLRVRTIGVAGLMLLILATTNGSGQQSQERLSVADFMSAGEYQRAGLQKLTSEERSQLDAWFTTFVMKLTQISTTPATRAAATLDSLEGAIIVADDGQFLGKITERRAGELLAAAAKAGERHNGHGDQKSESHRITPIPTLAALGITKQQSAAWQKLAAISDEAFEERLSALAKPSTNGVVNSSSE